LVFCLKNKPVQESYSSREEGKKKEGREWKSFQMLGRNWEEPRRGVEGSQVKVVKLSTEKIGTRGMRA